MSQEDPFQGFLKLGPNQQATSGCNIIQNSGVTASTVQCGGPEQQATFTSSFLASLCFIADSKWQHSGKQTFKKPNYTKIRLF
ncbi:MAG: hypothetical protein LCH81_08170 [Bacteroidetes bacterium]|nr:hypothetical protein [Bacteroidota bacterium]